MNSDAVIESILSKLLRALGVEYSNITKSEVAGQKIFSIQIEDGRALIGTRGDTVHAIDSLVKKIAEKELGLSSSPSSENAENSSGENPLYFLVDVNEYRTKQIKDLQNKALMMAERARSFQYDVELTPMSSYERLIIHSTLSGAPHIKTESQGEGRNRRVVIRYVSA
ncbi:hypothetical protein C4585_02855 [Candidatus Parcubacteria bacterium]|nr:MAG: hypothetical protein C4585_02855 [Candidatus Parcubacteria bacterium]